MDITTRLKHLSVSGAIALKDEHPWVPSTSYPILYGGHHVTDYLYDHAFSSGEVVKIFTFKEESEIKTQRFYNKKFGIKKVFSLFFQKKKMRNR